ncbi:predicted protein [Naegleria gruberi]|uniref:Predicted protein n=1 Tax=Naegleria gruberi TaxID=5762 RepID=D2UZY2_NAEGR|nr:uncharacterized protein NAEGRDRAFT_62103 [Naegleria gruberi]EFC50242.1 predicted protein [Naegleria gruberi]|eukprot:XP_002682986.1 predicted protein [Naegleria gruberi strain NEG-M]
MFGGKSALSQPPSPLQKNNTPTQTSYEKMKQEREEQLEAEDFEQRREEIKDSFQKQFFNNLDPNEFKKAWEQSKVDETAEYKKITMRQQLRWWIKDHDRFDRFIKLLINPTATTEEKEYAKQQIDEMIKLYGEVRTRHSNRKKIPARLSLALVLFISLISWFAVEAQHTMVNKERQDQILGEVVKRSQPTEEMKNVPQVNHREILQEIENQKRLQKLKAQQKE